MVALLLLLPARAGELSGTVTDADGQPLSLVAVYAYDLRLKSSGILTNTSGGFLLTDLPEGRYRILARPDDEDNSLSRFYPDVVDYCDSPLLTLGEDDLRIALPTGGELTGQIIADAPAGLRVIARSVPDTATEYAFEREAETDTDGRFLLRGLDGPGPWAIELGGEAIPGQYLGATYTEAEADLFDVTPGQRTDAGTHSALSGVTVTGHITGPGDEAVPSASVIVYSGSQIKTVTTDEDGAYIAVGLPPGDALSWTEPDGLALTYAPSDDRPTTFAVTTSEGEVLEDLDITVPAEATLQVTVTGEADGEPIGGASVTLYNDTFTVGKGGSLDDDGVVTLDNLYGGGYHLFVYAADEGYVDAWQLDDDGERRRFEVTPGQPTELTVSVPLGGIISGQITDDDGAPVYGATVSATAGDLYEYEQTDRDGRYVLTGLAAEDWLITVTSSYYCPADPGFVSTYWPGAVASTDAAPLTLAEGEIVDGVDLTMPRDDDHDGMGDRWEEEHGLDPGRDDSLEDPDGDGLSNISEYLAGTDPMTPDALTESCGCRGDATAALAAPLLLLGFRRRRRRDP